MSASQDLFSGPRQLISHANDEIRDAESIVKKFNEQLTTLNQMRFDKKKNQNVFYMKITGPEIPAKLSNIVKDAAENLRAALDHVVYSSAVALNGGSPSNTGFPFADDAAGVLKRLGGNRLSDNPIELHEIFVTIAPHENGNKLLWALNKIRNASTHRFIVPVGTAVGGHELYIKHARINGNSTIGYSKWNPQTKEVEYMRLSPESTIEYNVSIVVGIVFEGVKHLEGRHVIDALKEMAIETERAVSAIESETLKILSGRNLVTR